jgi:hypothetical protein
LSPRQRAGGVAHATARLGVAREYFLLASLEASEDRAFAHNAAAGNAVLAAVAASDAICCVLRGLYHRGDDHNGAVDLLRSVGANGPELAKDLAKVLAVKDQVHYSGEPIPASEMRTVLRSTSRLVDEAERLLGDSAQAKAQR